jgi:hypothetical protein
MKIKLFLTLFAAFTVFVSAQKMKFESGDLKFLKGQTELNVEMNFDKTTFYNEKMSEEEYIEKRTKEISADKGKSEADKWLSDWGKSKGDFADKFISSLNKNCDIKASVNADAKYTVIVETTWIYPGWFAGVMKQPAKVSTLLKFVETANPGKVLAVINSQNAPGDSFMGVGNNNDRISEGYAKTGKTLAGLVKKGMK